MFGHVDAWMKKYILGIRLAPDAVGGDKVIIDPRPLCGVKWAKGSLTVATGTIHVEWRLLDDGTIDLDYSLPSGSVRVRPSGKENARWCAKQSSAELTE